MLPEAMQAAHCRDAVRSQHGPTACTPKVLCMLKALEGGAVLAHGTLLLLVGLHMQQPALQYTFVQTVPAAAAEVQALRDSRPHTRGAQHGA